MSTEDMRRYFMAAQPSMQRGGPPERWDELRRGIAAYRAACGSVLPISPAAGGKAEPYRPSPADLDMLREPGIDPGRREWGK